MPATVFKMGCWTAKLACEKTYHGRLLTTKNLYVSVAQEYRNEIELLTNVMKGYGLDIPEATKVAITIEFVPQIEKPVAAKPGRRLLDSFVGHDVIDVDDADAEAAPASPPGVARKLRKRKKKSPKSTSSSPKRIKKKKGKKNESSEDEVEEEEEEEVPAPRKGGKGKGPVGKSAKAAIVINVKGPAQ